MRSLVKLAFNDILKNGFDSVAQECYLRINKPELADEVYRRHGHAPDWEKLKRDNRGRFDHVSGLVKGLVKVAEQLDNKGLCKEADKIDELLRFIKNAGVLMDADDFLALMEKHEDDPNSNSLIRELSKIEKQQLSESSKI